MDSSRLEFIMLDKNELRRLLKALRKSLSVNQRAEYNEKIYQQVIKLPSYQKATWVYCYITTQSEVDCVPIIEKAFSDGKRVAVPKVDKDGMEFYEILALDECEKGTFRILEPKTKRLVRPEENSKTLILVPGLAYDHKKNRMGYGKGYYDRYFHKYGETKFERIAIAYDLQVVKEVPSEPTDVRVDTIITEYKTY